MTSHTKSCTFALVILVLCLAVPLGNRPAEAQAMPGLAGPLSVIGSLLGGMRRGVEGDMPGLANPRSPLVFPPVFRGELRARPLYVKLSGTLTSIATGESLSLDRDITMIRDVAMFETMARCQLGRLSFRIHNDNYISGFRGDNIRVDWPNWRFGVDYDIVNKPGLRLGLNADWSPFHPSISFSDLRLGTYDLRTDQPVSAGVHAVYNGQSLWGISPSLESRYRVGLVERSKVNEVEVAAGLRGPDTVVGCLALRGGWRGTWFNLSDNAYKAEFSWSAIFGELVYYY